MQSLNGKIHKTFFCLSGSKIRVVYVLVRNGLGTCVSSCNECRAKYVEQNVKKV